jgi:Na+-transporting NADH:ubiquinone oxidoreductase subunit NqrF
MMKQFACKETDMKMTILYGCKDDCDLLFEKELDDLCQRFPDRLRRFNTYEKTDSSNLRQGYIDADFIRNNVPDPSVKTYFICGPSIMYSFVEKELQKLGALERKQMRFEVGGTPDNVTLMTGYPSEQAEKTVNMDVHIGESRIAISAKTSESILVAVEKSGLVLDSCCRSGECGICRSKLISGEVYILPDHDGRRAVDKELGYIHPCSTYPLSDLTIRIPPGKHVKEPLQKQASLRNS